MMPRQIFAAHLITLDVVEMLTDSLLLKIVRLHAKQVLVNGLFFKKKKKPTHFGKCSLIQHFWVSTHNPLQPSKYGYSHVKNVSTPPMAIVYIFNMFEQANIKS
ncbi:unnamed protein product [Staurois parvus]|uniref:Uncharacterized protein n=1 Tax=Staurois parvus TaxID=386267 RepID=A0ABN9GTN4_9NEOB|nr:unnamed protein product [Staurois parvus]